MTSYSLNNYYILASDLLRIIPSPKYYLLLITEIVAIVTIIVILYWDVATQVFYYYVNNPSYTKLDLVTMDNERALLDVYENPTSKYRLVCTGSNLLGIQTISNGYVVPALTISQQTIPNCNSIIGNLISLM